MLKNIVYTIASLTSGLLWRLGGAVGWTKKWRRIGCPVVIMLSSLVKTKNIFISLITGLILYGGCTLGYGLPSSDIAQFWLNVGVSTHLLLLVCVRATVGLAYSFSYLPTITYFYYKRKKSKGHYHNKRLIKNILYMLYTTVFVVLINVGLEFIEIDWGILRNDRIQEFLIGFVILWNYGRIRR